MLDLGNELNQTKAVEKDPQYLTTAEITKILSVGRARIYQLRREGLPHIKLGYKTIRYDRAAFHEWLNNRRLVIQR